MRETIVRLATSVALTGVIAFAALGCGAPDEAGADRQVAASNYGDDWPLTVDGGRLWCKQPGAVTFVAPDGTVYAVNGTAKDFNRGADIAPIWADDPDVEGLKMDIGPLIEDGLELCGPT